MDRRRSVYFSNFPPSTLLNLQTNVWKIRNINWARSSQATSFKLGEYNLLLSLNLKFKFAKSYLPSNSHTNTVISDRFAHPWRCGGKNRDKAYSAHRRSQAKCQLVQISYISKRIKLFLFAPILTSVVSTDRTQWPRSRFSHANRLISTVNNILPKSANWHTTS